MYDPDQSTVSDGLGNINNSIEITNNNINKFDSNV